MKKFILALLVSSPAFGGVHVMQGDNITASSLTVTGATSMSTMTVSSGTVSILNSSSATINNTTPQLYFTESDQTLPAGKYSIFADADILNIGARNSNDTANIVMLSATRFSSSFGPLFVLAASGTATTALRFSANSNSGKYTEFISSPTISGSNRYYLPPSSGTAGQAILTDGANNLYFGSVATTAGGSGSVNASTKTYIPYYSVTGSSNVLSGSPGISVTTITATGLVTLSTFTASSGTISILNINGSGAGELDLLEGTAPTLVGGTGTLWADSTSHSLKTGAFAITQSSTNAVNALTIVSTGTGNAVSITNNGKGGGAVQSDTGGGLNILQTTVGDAVVIVSSYTDDQIGSSDLLILDRNVNRNDPIIRVLKNASNSAPEMRWDSPAPNMETVATSTDNTVGRGKWEPFATPAAGEILQVNSRCWDNTSFENIAYWEPLNIQAAINKPGLYLRNSDSTGCDSGIVTSSNTSGINFFTVNNHTVGLTGPLNVASGSWRLRLPSTIPTAGQVLYTNAADSSGDYPIEITSGGSTGQVLTFQSGSTPTWSNLGITTNTWSGAQTYTSSVTFSSNVIVNNSATVNIASNTILSGATFYQNGRVVVGTAGQSVQFSSNVFLAAGATFYYGGNGGLIRMGGNNASLNPVFINGGNDTATGAIILIGNHSGTLPGANITTADGVCIGGGACRDLITGTAITAVGTNALLTSTSNSNSTGIGANAMSAQLNGGQNTAIGVGSLDISTSGSNMTAIGYQACHNTVGTSTTTLNGGICIGRGSYIDSNATMAIGSPGFPITDIFVNGVYQTTNNTAGSSVTFHSQTSSGTDKAGGTIAIAAGQGTGTGASGDVVIKIATTTATGTTINGLVVISSFTTKGLSVVNGHHFNVTNSTQPLITSCGTSPSVIGTDTAFTITVGAAAGGCTATFSRAYTNVPVCTVSQQSMSVVNALSYTTSATAITMTQTGMTGNIDVHCIGRD